MDQRLFGHLTLNEDAYSENSEVITIPLQVNTEGHGHCCVYTVYLLPSGNSQ